MNLHNNKAGRKVRMKLSLFYIYSNYYWYYYNARYTAEAKIMQDSSLLDLDFVILRDKFNGHS